VGVEQNVPAEQQATVGGGDQSKRANERREELTNYEVSTKTTSTISDGYRIEALTVAVLVNRKQLLASLGDKATPDAVDKQLKEVERLVASAAGIDTKRGDRVTVSALEFVQGGQMLEPVPGIGMVEHVLRHTGSIVNALAVVAVAMLLIWFGLRPAMKAILEVRPGALSSPSAQPQAAPRVATAEAAGAQVTSESQPNLIADLTSKLGRTPQKRLEQMTDFDEEQAAAILKQWMHGARNA
jgi:flagellar M-ring protein FliF